ncbi:MAG: transposase, partial [Gammaproteobacteria bacterium]|nr:transposase [Gammaproteobacteria bacterium]
MDYFMITFTLPAGLRGIAQAQPQTVYSAVFSAASDTVKGFGARKLKAELGQCAVLHTHSRRLDLHPHLHVVVPGGGIDAQRRQWRKLKGRYLFNAFALARVFRARLLRALHDADIAIPAGLPPTWVVDCRHVGNGEPALEYLSRYLYRGVLRQRDLVAYDEAAGTVTFRDRDAKTRSPAYRTLPIADFLWHLLLHVLPTGLHRVRDYGFLHGNAKSRLALVQLVLRV